MTTIPELEYPWWMGGTLIEICGVAVLAMMILAARMCR
jgi:hypothetical protein